MNLEIDSMGKGPPSLPRMKMGDVVGIRGVKLNVGSGPDHSSVLTATNRDLTLITNTVFVLVPMNEAVPVATVVRVASQPAPAAAVSSTGTTPPDATAAT